ncbi:hypothetical protein H4R19_005704, partial [Coemansia spiralis]
REPAEHGKHGRHWLHALGDRRKQRTASRRAGGAAPGARAAVPAGSQHRSARGGQQCQRARPADGNADRVCAEPAVAVHVPADRLPAERKLQPHGVWQHANCRPPARQSLPVAAAAGPRSAARRPATAPATAATAAGAGRRGRGRRWLVREPNCAAPAVAAEAQPVQRLQQRHRRRPASPVAQLQADKGADM